MKKPLIILTFALIVSFSGIANAADKVVVVPVGGKNATGDAVAADVLEGKTFSNQYDVGIVGTMPINTRLAWGCDVTQQRWLVTKCKSDCTSDTGMDATCTVLCDEIDTRLQDFTFSAREQICDFTSSS